MSAFAAGDGKEEREENPSDVARPSATDWNERFSSLCGVLKGIKEEQKRETEREGTYPE